MKYDFDTVLSRTGTGCIKWDKPLNRENTVDFPTFSKLCLQCCANNRILKDVLKFYNCMMPSSYPLLHIQQCRTIA